MIVLHPVPMDDPVEHGLAHRARREIPHQWLGKARVRDDAKRGVQSVQPLFDYVDLFQQAEPR